MVVGPKNNGLSLINTISDTFVVMGSDNGLSLINTLTADVTEIYDSLFVPKQILVVEEKSIAIVRAEKGELFFLMIDVEIVGYYLVVISSFTASIVFWFTFFVFQVKIRLAVYTRLTCQPLR